MIDINPDDDLFDDAIYYAILTIVQNKAKDQQQCWQTAMLSIHQGIQLGI